MKKIVTLAAFALICSGAFAQFNQGRYLVGGSLGLSTSTTKYKTDNSTTTISKGVSFSLAPDAGYFVIDNLAVGAGIGLTISTDNGAGDDDTKSSSTSIMFSPFVRYYLQQGIFFHGQVGFGSVTSKYKYDGSNTTDTDKTGRFDWALGAGYAYFINDYVAIEPMVGFQAQAYKDDDTDNKATDAGLFIRVGFQIYLGARN